MFNFLKIRKAASEIIPLNEQERSTYKVKQVVKEKKREFKYPRLLMITEEGVKVHDSCTREMILNIPWREMAWFELRPALQKWVIHTKKTSKLDKKIRFSSSQATRIHAEAENYLDRFIRNYKLALHEPEKEPDFQCVRELMDELHHPITARAGGGAN